MLMKVNLLDEVQDLVFANENFLLHVTIAFEVKPVNLLIAKVGAPPLMNLMKFFSVGLHIVNPYVIITRNKLTSSMFIS